MYNSYWFDKKEEVEILNPSPFKNINIKIIGQSEKMQSRQLNSLVKHKVYGQVVWTSSNVKVSVYIKIKWK
jgi:hypothetical protein